MRIFVTEPRRGAVLAMLMFLHLGPQQPQGVRNFSWRIAGRFSPQHLSSH